MFPKLTHLTKKLTNSTKFMRKGGRPDLLFDESCNHNVYKIIGNEINVEIFQSNFTLKNDSKFVKMFGQTSSFGSTGGFGGNTGGGISLGLGNQANPMKDVEVTNPPDDSISCLRFSPPSVTTTSFLIAGSWDNNCRCWEIQSNGQSVPKAQQAMQVSELKRSRAIWNTFPMIAKCPQN